MLKRQEKKRQARNRGLTKVNNEQRIARLRRLGRRLAILAGVSVIVSLAVFLIYLGGKSVRNMAYRPIAEVSVESDFNYVHRQDIMHLISGTLHQSFLSENLNRVKTELEKSAWISHVVLSRRWPDHLHVKVVEQTPIARWSGSGFINHRGELVAVGDTERLAHLPQLVGPVEDSVELLEQYQTISRLLGKYNLKIASLIKSQHHRWMVELTNGWQINIGKGRLMEKMQRFDVVLKNQLLGRDDLIAVIDMRYQHGVAVRWLKSETEITHLQRDNLPFAGGI